MNHLKSSNLNIEFNKKKEIGLYFQELNDQSKLLKLNYQLFKNGRVTPMICNDTIASLKLIQQNVYHLRKEFHQPHQINNQILGSRYEVLISMFQILNNIEFLAESIYQLKLVCYHKTNENLKLKENILLNIEKVNMFFERLKMNFNI